MFFQSGLCSLIVASLFAQVKAGDDVSSRLVRSTAWVRTTTQGVGTGWVVDVKRRWLITNLHVVGEQDRVEAFFPVERDGKLVAERQFYLENQKTLHEEGKAVRGKVILRRETSDLALIELEKLPAGVQAMPLAEKGVGPGHTVHSVGHRHDSDALWNYTTGEVRQIGKLTDGYFWRGKKLASNMPCLLLQSPINVGDSGSALVNDRGEVVGVISGVRWQAPITAIAIQVSEVRALLAEAEKKDPPPNPAAVASEVYRKLCAATCWVRPTATEGRSGCWIVDRQRKLILTTASGAGSSDLVDVLFPLMDKSELVAEATAYVDRIGLRQKGQLVRGIVLMRDPKRDLALIELESLPKDAAALTMAKKEPLMAEKIHVVSHPGGVELLWLYSTGVVRQVANVELIRSSMGESLKPRTLLLQIPHQAGSAGGAVVNERGQVVGMLAAKESAQQQLGYAITAAELQAFLDTARPLFAPKSAEEFVRRAKWLVSHGKIPDGEDSFYAAFRFEKELRDSTREAFHAFLRAGALKQASYFGASLVTLSPNPACHAIVLAINNKSSQARKICKTILDEDRKCALAYLARGMLTMDKDALTDLDEAIFFDPNLIEAYRQRARVHEKLDDDHKALADWSRAIELDPYSTEPIRRRIAVYLKKNEPKRAIADCERLIELVPTDAEAHRALAGAWLAQGDEAKALPAFIAALRWQPKLRNMVLEDFIKHGQDLARRWPDDTTKKAKWYEQALPAIRNVDVEAIFKKQLDVAMASRKKEWDDRRWGEELEALIRLLVSK